MYPFDLLKVRLQGLRIEEPLLKNHRHDYRSSTPRLAAFTRAFQMLYQQYPRRKGSGLYGEAYQVSF